MDHIAVSVHPLYIYTHKHSWKERDGRERRGKGREEETETQRWERERLKNSRRWGKQAPKAVKAFAYNRAVKVPPKVPPLHRHRYGGAGSFIASK